MRRIRRLVPFTAASPSASASSLRSPRAPTGSSAAGALMFQETQDWFGVMRFHDFGLRA
jgi:hypothetical protein